MIQLLKMPSQKAEAESLFSGIWVRWRTLNLAERFVCGIIVLLPLWWVLGIIPYLLYLIATSVAAYEWRQYKKLRLQRPSLVVIALFAYFAYECLGSVLLYFDAHPLASLPPDAARKPLDLVEAVLSVFAFPYLVWYIQSNNVRVRLEVVAWACSVSIIQSLGLWLVVHFVYSEAFYTPQRTLWAVLTGKSQTYYRGIGNTNYLVMYWPDDKAIAGFSRFYSFFHGPESFGLFVGVVGTLALDLKNRLWSVLLVSASAFLVGLSGTRAVWIAFPTVVFIRLWFTTGKFGGSWLPFALTATMSFVTLSLTPVTEAILSTSSKTIKFISDFRANSTEQRSGIYEGSIRGVLDNPVNFLFGYQVIGEGGVGSHSFLLGSLLYQGGLISTGCFMTFWAALMMWIYRTRAGRPACSFTILLLLTLTFATMLFAHIAPMAILLSMMLGRPTSYQRKNAAYA